VKKKPAKKKLPAKKSAAKPKPAVKKGPPEKLDWVEIETSLHALVVKTIGDFAKKHSNEVFYALYFDFPERWSGIRIHLNTPELLRKRSEEYIRSNPELYARRTAEAVANDIRWEPGDFGYFEINGTKVWAKKWAKYSEQLEAAAAAQDVSVYATGEFVELKFLLTASRVLLRLESDESLNCLPRTRNFRTCCMTHEERPEDAWKRMHLLRLQFVAAPVAMVMAGKKVRR
jgi:hypothetical protein